jgi:hypothetical protein
MAIIGVIVLLFGLFATLWVYKSKANEQKYIKQQHALKCMTAIGALITLAITTISSKQGLWDHFREVFALITGSTYQPDEPAQLSEKILITVLALVGSYFILVSYLGWNGKVSVEDERDRRMHRSKSIITQAVEEGARIIRRRPKPPAYEAASRTPDEIFPPPKVEIVWHEHARELFELWYPMVSFATTNAPAWDVRTKCWHGRDRRQQKTLFLFCYQDEPSPCELNNMAAYVRSLEPNEGYTAYAVHRGNSQQKNLDDATSITIMSEAYLLANIVDFSDYIADIKNRAEADHFADTTVSICDIYTPSSISTLGGKVVSEDMGDYISSWSAQPPGRQLAVLGDYGQGKSTGALMFVYDAISSNFGKSAGRIPILFELRGKSPANLLPQELLATWGNQYKIHALALLKLLLTSR